MRLMRFLSQKGFSLPEVAIAVGLMGGMSVVTMKLMDNQKAGESELKVNAEISKVVSQVAQYVGDKERCEQMFLGQTRPTSLTTLDVRVNATESKTILTSNTTYGSDSGSLNFRIPANGIQLMASNFGPAITDLVLTFRVKKRSLFGRSSTGDAPTDRVVIKRIPFVTEINTTGTAQTVRTDYGTVSVPAGSVMACGPIVSDANVSAQKKLCQSMGGLFTWDDGTNECTMDSNALECPSFQVATQLTSLGTLVCKPIEQVVNPDNLFDYTPVNCTGDAMRIITQAGKLKIYCP